MERSSAASSASVTEVKELSGFGVTGGRDGNEESGVAEDIIYFLMLEAMIQSLSVK